MLNRWTNDPHRLDRRMFGLIVLAHAGDVLENAFAPLNDEVGGRAKGGGGRAKTEANILPYFGY